VRFRIRKEVQVNHQLGGEKKDVTLLGVWERRAVHARSNVSNKKTEKEKNPASKKMLKWANEKWEKRKRENLFALKTKRHLRKTSDPQKKKTPLKSNRKKGEKGKSTTRRKSGDTPRSITASKSGESSFEREKKKKSKKGSSSV